MIDVVHGRILQALAEARGSYYRLVLVVGPARSGKSAGLRTFAERGGAPLINVSLELSSQMLELSERQRALRASQILGNVVKQDGASTVLLDNLEILFDPSLQLDPLRVLLSLSRRQTIIAAWGGTIQRGNVARVTYAAPEHPEFRTYTVRDFIVVDLSEGATQPA